MQENVTDKQNKNKQQIACPQMIQMLELIDKVFRITKFKILNKIQESNGTIDENMEKLNRKKRILCKNEVEILD